MGDNSPEVEKFKNSERGKFLITDLTEFYESLNDASKDGIEVILDAALFYEWVALIETKKLHEKESLKEVEEVEQKKSILNIQVGVVDSQRYDLEVVLETNTL